MKVSEKKIKIALPGTDLIAIVSLEREGQQPPYEGDNVVVIAKVKLPGIERSGSIQLRSEICFGDRLVICKEPLTSFWGSAYPEEYYRYKYKFFNSDKWSKAFAEAEEWATGEVNKLVEALEKRVQALADAE